MIREYTTSISDKESMKVKSENKNIEEKKHKTYYKLLILINNTNNLN